MGQRLPLRGRSHEELRRRFRWSPAAHLNIGSACVDTHPPGRLALIDAGAGPPRTYTFGELARASNRMANVLGGLGGRRGDRVAVLLPQSPETAIAHLGAYKAGMIGLPLSALFGPDALRYRLQDSGARTLITDVESYERIRDLRADLPDLRDVVLVDGGSARGEARSFAALLSAASSDPEPVESAADDPAVLIYTSGTTGPAKGVLHAHRVLVGQSPGFRLAHEFLPRRGDLVWTPADWAWIGGLVNTLLLAWFHGVPVVAAARRGFDPEWALDLIARVQVRNAFLPTTALRMMVQHTVPAGIRLRSLVSGGESQDAALMEATEAAFGMVSNESYGQTEADFVIGHCASRWPARPGSMGLPYPGHDVRLEDESGAEVEAGQTGEIVVRAPDPTLLIEYWRRPDATAAKFRGDWLRTGDLARADEDGYLWFETRADDVIKSAGYRIGPSEVEECLLRHEAVAQAAVVGVPDRLRGQVVKAVVVLRRGFRPSRGLEASLQRHVRERLAAYQYPRLVEFTTALPMSPAGKVDRRRLRESGTSPAGEAPGSLDGEAAGS